MCAQHAQIHIKLYICWQAPHAHHPHQQSPCEAQRRIVSDFRTKKGRRIATIFCIHNFLASNHIITNMAAYRRRPLCANATPETYTHNTHTHLHQSFIYAEYIAV